MSTETGPPVSNSGAGGADESTLIERYFAPLGAERGDVRLGIGDDAALLQLAPGCDLVMTTDTLVEGTHFLPGSEPRSLGHRAMAVNLSDLAAMGAKPCWALLSLTMPDVDHLWLQGFCAGFGGLLREHAVALVGGNLARGPLNITVQLTGQVSAGTAITRSGARVGDVLCLTGSVGDAAAGLDIRRGVLAAGTAARDVLCQRFEYPSARVAIGQRLIGVASACIDVSDGLWRDLGRMLASSGCGARIVAETLPLTPALQETAGNSALRYALEGGEDYELLIAVPRLQLPLLLAAAGDTSTPCTVIGECTTGPGPGLWRGGEPTAVAGDGFDHFPRRC
jgi:thiamine-monophosphate kinase